MPITASKINPCLWFDTEAKEAARFYCSIFKNSKVGTISRYGREGKKIHGKEAGSVMAVEFELERRPEICRAERWPAIQVQRGDLVSDPLRRPERSRVFLGEAFRWRCGRTLRLLKDDTASPGRSCPIMCGRLPRLPRARRSFSP